MKIFLKNGKATCFGPHSKIKLLLDYWDEAPLREVPDPYYNDAFEESYRLIEKACLQLLEKTRLPLPM
jgi:protein-tyrosine-phosphatase